MAIHELQNKQLKMKPPQSNFEENEAEGDVLILGWAVAIGVVLLAAFAAGSAALYGDLSLPPGSGNSGIS